MKERFLFCFILIVAFSITLVSASLFGDFWNKITGKVTGDINLDWTQVGPPHIAWNNCNIECANKGMMCSETGCPEAVNTYGSHNTFTGGEKLIAGGITTGYACDTKWGNLSDNRYNYCCCISTPKEEEHLCIAVTSGHEINIGIYGNSGQPRLVDRQTCLKIISEYKKEIENYTCLNGNKEIENIRVEWGLEIIHSSWIIYCRTNISNQNCSDGTFNLTCSSNKPKYCLNGNLIDKCSVCGCEVNYVCDDNDQCKVTTNICDVEGERECVGNGYHVCRKYLNEETGKQYLDWHLVNCSQGCQNGMCNENPIKIQCNEEIKEGLCGNSQDILPLSNYNEGNDINIYSNRDILEDSNFKFVANYSNFVYKNEPYTFRLEITNKQATSQILSYTKSFICQPDRCHYEIISQNLDSFGSSNGKIFSSSFQPYEEKVIQITLKATQPTLVIDVPFFNFEYLQGTLNRSLMLFRTYVKIRQGESQSILCNNKIYTEFLPSPPGDNDLDQITYSKGVCCQNIFYPSAECCNDDYCKENEWSNGHCVDGRCMDKIKLQNRLYGNKTILYVTSVGDTDNCQEITPSSIVREHIEDLENYYDNMAEKVISQSDDFVNFELSKTIVAPSSFRGRFSQNESEISNEIFAKCNINISNYDIVVFPIEATNFGESASYALGIGSGKTILVKPLGTDSSPAIIHEIGHLYGCSDLYFDLGGRLQWRNALYGLNRNMNNQVYGQILRKEFDNITNKVFAVCKGELGWTDLDGNGIIDITETGQNINFNTNTQDIQIQLNQGQMIEKQTFFGKIANWFKRLF